MEAERIKILAIDDHQDNLISLKALIQEAFPAAVMLQALNGTTGLELAAAEEPDVILLDIVMPGMDGFEVCQRLKAAEGLRTIPVIFLTALKGDRESRIRALEAGGEAFLAKPIDEIELTAQIRAMLKIRGSNLERRDEKHRLDALVAEQTVELRKTHRATLNLLEDLKAEIEERKKVELSLRNSEEHHRIILQTAMDGIWLTDGEGHLLEVNETYCRMTGYTVQELMTLQISDLEARENAADVSRHIQEIKEQGESRFESRHRRKDGSAFDVEASVRYRPGDGGQFVVFVQDISRRKQDEQVKATLEEQLQQAQKMESIGRLAGGVAHDFNNMLSVILGHAEIALMRMDQTQPLYVPLSEIKKAAERSADLTRQLLAFARKQTVSPKVIDLNETVVGMLNMLQRLIGENIHLTWKPWANLWPVIMDKSQIDQIMANLFVNARDAIADVGEISIEMENRSIDKNYCKANAYAVPGEYVRIAISDTGKGMDKETLDHIFEPFFTTKGVGEGTGLGLSTVYGIVKQNNGFINVYSEPGTGTTFTIYLPRHVGKAEQAQSSDTAAPLRQGSETLLLVEDEPAILEMTTLILTELGYTVLKAGSPGEAISKAREHTGDISLLMTDVIMPEMNGRDLAKNLLSLYPQIKCIFMSGYTSDIIAHHGVLDEGVHFLQKPFQLKALATKLREVLDG